MKVKHIHPSDPLQLEAEEVDLRVAVPWACREVGKVEEGLIYD